MTVTIKELDGTELLSSEFSRVSIDNSIYSITLSIAERITANLTSGKPYKVIFLDADSIGLSGEIIMAYNTYSYNASTAIMTNEFGEKETSIQVNSNTISFIHY